jgi:hypothetical protein
MTPETATARLITSTEAMMMTTELENPENALAGGTTPVSMAADSASAPTRSYRSRSEMNRVTMPAMMAKASIWCRVKGMGPEQMTWMRWWPGDGVVTRL